MRQTDGRTDGWTDGWAGRQAGLQTNPLTIPKGCQAIRFHHKCDESKLLP